MFIEKSYVVWVFKASYLKINSLPKRYYLYSQAGSEIIWNSLVRKDFFFNRIPAK